MFKIRLDSKKAIEAAAVLARQSPDRKISRKRLLALLYLANRLCLKRSGRPIVGGRIAAMKYGPIHADVYDLIQMREEIEGSAEWSQRFQNEGYSVILRDDPTIESLSRFEIGILTEVTEEHKEEDDWDVTWHTHALPEYKMTYQSGRVKTIPLEQVIHAVGLTSRRKQVLRDLKEKEEIDDIFANAEREASSQKGRNRKNGKTRTRK